MHRACDDFLADAAFAGDQDGNRGPGRPLAQPLDHGHGRRGADQVAEAGASGGVLLQPVDLAPERAHGERVADGDDDPLGRGGLDEEVERAGLHGLDDGVDAAGGGDHDDRLVEAARAHLDQGVLAGHAGHDHVEQDDVDRRARPQAIDRQVAVLGVHDRKALALEDRLDQPTLRRVVIDDEDRFGHKKTPTVTGRRLMDESSCCHELIQGRRKDRVSET